LHGRARVVGILAVLLGIGAPRPSWGLWPLDRRMPTDSLSAPEWDTRFQTWKQRPVGVPDSAQAASATAMEELRKATQSGVFDSALLAKLAKQAQSGQLDMPTPSAKKTDTPTSAAVSDSIQGQTPGANMVGSADSLSGEFGAGGSLEDSTQAAANADVSAPAASPFQGLNNAVPTVIGNRGFAPAFSAMLNSNNDRMALTSSLSASLADRSGLILTASLGHNQELRLSQGSENESKNLLTSLTLPIHKVGLTFGVSASDGRRTSLGARSVSSGRTSDSSENKLASTQVAFARQIVPSLGLAISYDRRFTLDEQSIASTQTSSAGERSTQTTGNSYGAGITYDPAAWMKLKGRYGRAVNDQLFTSPSFVTPENPSGEDSPPPSEGDTISVRVDMPLGRLVPQLSADFQVRRTEFSYTDVSRTSSGSIQDATQFAVETETRFSRLLRIDGRFEPWKFLSANFGAELARDSVSAALRTNVFEDAKRVRWTVGGTVRYPGNGQLRVTLDGTRADVDKNDPKSITQPLNPQTRVDESHQLSGEILQNLTNTMKVRLYGNVELAQGFYAHPGPTGFGDRDDLRAQLGGDLDGRISSKSTARVEAYVRGFNQAFIDPRRSKDSRDETEYVIRTRFDYQITPRVALKQFYGLSSKVVDETFDPNGDTLNRNHFLQTTFNFQMTSRLTLDTRFDYRLQDNGLYILRQPRSPERIFAPTARTKTDEIALGIRYALIQGGKLNFVSTQVSTREHRTIFFNGRATGVNVIERGNVAMGLESNITMGDLRLDAKVARNQSFNVSLNRNVYYNVQSTLSYTF